MKRRLTLQFPREAVHQPITYRLAVDYDVASRIIRAQVAPNQRGTLVVELSGDIDELDAAQEWLMSLGLTISSAAGEIAIDPSAASTAASVQALPSGALSCSTPDWRLQFDQRRCVVCEQCIAVCPLDAISLKL